MEDDIEILETIRYRGYDIAVIDPGETRDLGERYFIVTAKDGETAEFWDLDDAEEHINALEDGPGESYEDANAEHRLRKYQLV